MTASPYLLLDDSLTPGGRSLLYTEPEEIVAAGEGIVLVPPRNPVALAGAIDTLLGDPARLEGLGHAARTTVGRCFTWRRCGAETIAAYEEALARAT